MLQFNYCLTTTRLNHKLLGKLMLPSYWSCGNANRKRRKAMDKKCYLASLYITLIANWSIEINMFTLQIAEARKRCGCLFESAVTFKINF